jgi:nucleotide-binding universal stress UspA family protein
MNTVIVPVDFSETSLNAARYAAKFLNGHYGVTLVLYHSFPKEHEKDETIAKLEDLKNKLLQDVAMNIETLAYHEHDFVEGLEKTARHKNANLVIMGITGNRPWHRHSLEAIP